MMVSDARVKRARTEARKRMAKVVRDEYAADPDLRREVLEARLERPKIRGQCVDEPRPCPWISCRFHTAYEITRSGGLKDVAPGRELADLPETCSLDVADRGGVTLEQVAEALSLVRERARQIEAKALAKLRDALLYGSGK